jgi:hypothetical protein
MGIVPSSAAAWRGASDVHVLTVIVQPPDFSVADVFCQGEAYEPEPAPTSQPTFVASCLGVDDLGVRVGREIAIDQVERQDD